MGIRRTVKSKYLGITIDNELSWQCHMDDIYTKLLKFTSIYYTLRHKVSTVVLRMLYFAFVHLHLLYGVEVYANTHSQQLSRETDGFK